MMMKIESLDKILQFIAARPAYGIALLIIALFITILFWYLSSYIKEIGKQRAARGDDKESKGPLKTNEVEGQNHKKDLNSHFPSVTFSDGVLVDVMVTVNFRIFDAYKYTYEASEPLEILKTLVDSRIRSIFEKITIEQARERRRETEIELRSDLIDEFLKYGIELKEIILGAFQTK